MNINFWLNGVNRHAEISPDTLLIDFLRKQGCFSVKRGCETANCGLCTAVSYTHLTLPTTERV